MATPIEGGIHNAPDEKTMQLDPAPQRKHDAALCIQHPSTAVRTRHSAGVLWALLVIVLSGFTTALGVFLTLKETHVGSRTICTDCWDINPGRWNTAVAFFGAILGATSTLLLRMLVTYVAQRQLVTVSRATLRMFRPLEISDLARVFHNRKFAVQRAWALPILLATYLSSSATIALLGTSTHAGSARNAFGSASLGLLNDSLFYTSEDGSVFPDIAHADLSNFDGPIIKGATIASLIETGTYNEIYAQSNDLYLGGKIGNATYSDLDTGGIGVNVESYLRYTGSSDFYHPPTNYTFNRLTGLAWGINITVTCTPSSAFTVDRTPLFTGAYGKVTIYNVTGPNGVNYPFATNEAYLENDISPHALMIYANLTAVNFNVPISPTDWMNLVLIVPQTDFVTDSSATFFICSISAEQYLAKIEVSGVTGTVEYTPTGQSKDVSGPFLSQQVVQTLYEMVNLRVGRGIGQALDQFGQVYNDRDRLGRILSTTMSAASRMWISVLKQHYERASASVPNGHPDETFFTLEYTVQRVGGGAPWLFLPVLLLITGIVAAAVVVGPRVTAVVDIADPVAVAAVMIGSSLPELRGRCSGNPETLDADLLDGVQVGLRSRGDHHVEFTTDADAPTPGVHRQYASNGWM